MRTLVLALLLTPALVFAQAAAPPPAKPPAKKAEIYKWTDDKGVVHYTDKPPSKDAKPANLPALQTYRRGTNPDLSRFTPPSESGRATAGGAQIQVVTPSHDETFRGAERTVPVAVVVTPPLDANQKLVYLLDGKPAGSATSDTSFALTEVDRGQHSVAVTLVNGDGQELSRSAPVTFFMKPPGGGKK